MTHHPTEIPWRGRARARCWPSSAPVLWPVYHCRRTAPWRPCSASAPAGDAPSRRADGRRGVHHGAGRHAHQDRGAGGMTHPCAWASNKGRELHLSCPERVTLWQLAERAATKGYCWPSVVQLMVDTGLARQTILTVVRTLASLGLIRIEKDGQKHVYHVLLPVHNKTGNRSNTRPEPVQNKTSDRSNSVSQPVQNDDPNRSKINTLTLNRTSKRTSAREDAREPETEVLSIGKEGKQAARRQSRCHPRRR